MKRNKKKSFDDLFERAFMEGLYDLSKGDDGLSKYLFSRTDKQIIMNKADELKSYSNKEGMSLSDRKEFFYNEMKNYVASGAALKPSVKKIYGKGNLEKKVEKESRKIGKGFFERFFKVGKKDDTNKYSPEAFSELSYLFKAYGANERMPEIYGAIENVENANVLGNALEIVRGYGLIGKGKYIESKKKIKNIMNEGTNVLLQGIDKYLTPNSYSGAQNIAAVFLGLLGVGMFIFFKKGITGAVIGGVNMSHNSYGLLGGAFILVSFILFLKINYKKNKVQKVRIFKNKN